MLDANEAMAVISMTVLEYKGKPELEAKIKEIMNLADKVYNENFAGKRSRQEFGLFLATLVYKFADNFSELKTEVPQTPEVN